LLGDLTRLDRITPLIAASLRERVNATGFDERVPLPAERQDTTGVPEELRIPLIEWALARDAHPAASLALLFAHLRPVPADRIDRAIGRDTRRALEDAGLLVAEGNALRATLRMLVADGVFIWSDDAAAGPEAVMTPGPTTADLLAIIPTPIGGSFLDIGTGPGTLALLAKRRGAARAVGTDISERALVLARFNAAFNDLRIELRSGDMFAPVAGERFDWVMAQPPYVTHPPEEPGVAFLHGGAMGDELAFRFLEGAPAHLRASGIGIALFDSPVRADAPLHERVRAAVGPQLDVAVFNTAGLGMDRQALGYAALSDPTFGETYARTAVRYRAHLQRQGIVEITHSLVVARAPQATPHEGWTMTLVVPRFPDTWDELRAFVRGIDLAVAGEDALADARVRPREGATIVGERAPGASRDESRSIRFPAPSIALDRELTQAGAVIFDLLAAESSVASTIERFAKAMERPAADVRPLVTSFVKDCLIRALLVPD
jgi:methylase of polypeptide subunit release factors